MTESLFNHSYLRNSAATLLWTALFTLPLLAGTPAGYANLPLAFEPNQGQAPQDVQFLSRGTGHLLLLKPAEAVMTLKTGETVRLKLLGATGKAAGTLQEPQSGVSNYFVGRDPAQWRTGVPHFGRVQFRAVYPGVDLLYYGNQRRLEYDFILAPGADPSQIGLAYDGGQVPRANAHGDLILRTPGGELTQQRPIAYQTQNGQRLEVAAAYRLKGGKVQFALGKYDHSLPLVIDPVLVFSTYLGGNSDDFASAIAVDSTKAVYIAGHSSSSTYPVVGAIASGGNKAGLDDAVITKLNPAGSAIVYSTYLGGNNEDQAFGIAVDSSGAAYLTGSTASANFPIVNPLPNESSFRGVSDAFIAKLNPAGNALLFSTYFGGSARDEGHAIAVDGNGRIYITGLTGSSDFPVVNAIPGGTQFGGGNLDAFAAALTPAFSMVYSTYLGGSGDDYGNSIAADSTGAAYIAGTTYSPNLTVVNAIPGVGSPSSQVSSFGDAFVAKINPAGGSLNYLTYVAGDLQDWASSIAVDGSGNAYVAGYTESDNFPRVGPLPGGNAINGAGTFDAFALKLNSSGNALVYSTLLGGTGSDYANGIAIDASGAAYLTGYTNSTDFPLLSPLATNSILKGGFDGFVTAISPAGNAVLYSTYLGGAGNDIGEAIAVDGAGGVYVCGITSSQDFPTQGALTNLGTFQGGSLDGFVMKITAGAVVDATLLTPTPGSTLNGSTATFTWTPVAGAAGYWLDVGTALGQGNISAGAQTTTSRTVTNLPTSGTIYVRLWTNTGSGYLTPIDYTFTGSAATTASNAVLTTPTPGTTLPGSTATFMWNPVAGASAYWLDVGTSLGQGNLSRGQQTTTSRTVTNLPTDGSVVYVRLWTQVGGNYITPPNDYTFTASTAGQQQLAVLSTPTPGSTLSGSSVLFSWAAVSGASAYWLDVGNAVGMGDISAGEQTGTSRQVTVPTDGRTIYARLWTKVGSTYVGHNDYTFTASNSQTLAALASPTPGSTLPGSSATFSWNAVSGASAYWLDVGTAQGSGNLSAGEQTATTRTVTNLPTDGSTVWVRLWTKYGSTYVGHVDYSFTAANSNGQTLSTLVSPAPGSALTSSTATFTWTAVSGASAYWLDVGTAQGSGNLSAGEQTATTRTVTNLPTDGSTVWVRLWTKYGSTYVGHIDYSFTTQGLAALASPAPGTSISGTTQTFSWAAVSGASAYWLDVGTSIGTGNISAGEQTTTFRSVSNLPANGTVYVRLWTKYGSTYAGYRDYVFTTHTP